MTNEVKKEVAWMPLKQARVRPGSKAPWYELVVVKPDGSEVKLIARKVDRFYSERDETF